MSDHSPGKPINQSLSQLNQLKLYFLRGGGLVHYVTQATIKDGGSCALSCRVGGSYSFSNTREAVFWDEHDGNNYNKKQRWKDL